MREGRVGRNDDNRLERRIEVLTGTASMGRKVHHLHYKLSSLCEPRRVSCSALLPILR